MAAKRPKLAAKRATLAARSSCAPPPVPQGSEADPGMALRDRIVARTCRLADAMLRISSHHIRERWNIRNTDLRLLSTLDGEEPLSVLEISRRTLLDQAWVSRSLRALEAARLVQRRGDPRDSRLTLVRLTARGREILEESRPYAEWSERVLLEGVDEKTLKRLLDRLEANTQRLIDSVRKNK
jgi:DNA-binding MarR family transcriptional regulator